MIGLEQDLVGADGSYCVILARDTPHRLRSLESLGSISPELIRSTSAEGWSMVHSTGLDVRGADKVALACSGELEGVVLLVLYEDASGWLSYVELDSGARVRDYSSGYLDEEPPPSDCAERVLFDDDATTYLANGFDSSFSDKLLMGGFQFVDRLLKEHRAFLGWEAIGEVEAEPER